ncbi:MAG: hypothetical protein J5I90_00710 [Caldilineales bacterium]|nr:hypothetical protein [Caldilineales bacterium]
MTYIALLIAIAAIAYAYLIQRKIQETNKRLSRATSNLYQLSSQIEELEQRLDAQHKELAFEIKQATGQIQFSPNTTIGEVQAQHPQGEQILASFHMGGCHSCAVAPDETIASACERLNVSEAALLASLRNPANGQQPIQLSNIELQF